jgi:hypothetical protein
MYRARLPEGGNHSNPATDLNSAIQKAILAL